MLRGHYSTDVIDVIDVVFDVIDDVIDDAVDILLLVSGMCWVYYWCVIIDVQDGLSAFNIASREHAMVNHSEL